MGTKAGRSEAWLRAAFVAGAVTDALALVPMLFPSMARLVWGVDAVVPRDVLGTGYGASLMAGWTGLCAWAYRRPVERRFVAPLTIFVIAGLALTELVAVVRGDVAFVRMIPTWLLQAGLAALFAVGWRYAASSARSTNQ